MSEPAWRCVFAVSVVDQFYNVECSVLVRISCSIFVYVIDKVSHYALTLTQSHTSAQSTLVLSDGFPNFSSLVEALRILLGSLECEVILEPLSQSIECAKEKVFLIINENKNQLFIAFLLELALAHQALKSLCCTGFADFLSPYRALSLSADLFHLEKCLWYPRAYFGSQNVKHLHNWIVGVKNPFLHFCIWLTSRQTSCIHLKG